MRISDTRIMKQFQRVCDSQNRITTCLRCEDNGRHLRYTSVYAEKAISPGVDQLKRTFTILVILVLVLSVAALGGCGQGNVDQREVFEDG